jgi:hypothetical protein
MTESQAPRLRQAIYGPYGQLHGQEHGQANKQSIRRYSSLKIRILAISIAPVILQLFFMPSDYRAVLL